MRRMHSRLRVIVHTITLCTTARRQERPAARCPQGMSDDAADTSGVDDDEAYLRNLFERRARNWAVGRGLIVLLSELESELPHAMALACRSLESDARRPWVPEDKTDERQVGLAFRRASRHLHPDRMSTRDLSVRVEAEEYLKALSAAYDDIASWEVERATEPAKQPSSPGGHRENEEQSVARGGSDLRDNIFGADGAAPPRPAAAPPPKAASTKAGHAGGDSLRDEIFSGLGAAPKSERPPTREDRSATAPGGHRMRDNIFGAFGRKKRGHASSCGGAGKAGGPPSPSAPIATPFDACGGESVVSGASLAAADALFSGPSASSTRSTRYAPPSSAHHPVPPRAAATSCANPFDDQGAAAAPAAAPAAANPFDDVAAAPAVASANPFDVTDDAHAPPPASAPNPFDDDDGAPDDGGPPCAPPNGNPFDRSTYSGSI